ncbi:MAG: hypothetical protein AAF554_17095 [Bacteroidota bacterium]
MKRFNQASILLSVIIILVNGYLHWDLTSYLNKNPNDSANSGIGTAVLLMYRLYGTWLIIGLLFLISIILNILNKEILKPYSLLNFGLLVLAFFLPLLLV